MTSETFSDSESPEALFELGKKFYFSGRDSANDPLMALAYFEKAAQLGFPPAQRLLGVCLMEGQIVPRDILTSKKWLTAAADQADVQATYSLALIYAQGLDTDKDWAAAFRLLCRPYMLSFPEGAALKARLKAELTGLYPNLIEALQSTEKVHRYDLSPRQQRFIQPFLTPGRSELEQNEFEVWLALNLGRISQENTLVALQKCLTQYYAQMKAATPA
ncbi:MAG: hypothetical protein LBP22_11360 [Deltaproteobacteria bacterium]|jgi:hypothetical protein|nr:hypothetical protein [Deltaproteobacteria bacterium]